MSPNERQEIGSPGSEPELEASWTLSVDESSIDEDTPDAFGHTRYVDALEELITASSSGHTIGLFGGYGTGKTWIIKRLSDGFLGSGSNVGVVEYDAWRYADDEIRRDFLVNIHQELRDKGLYAGAVPDLDPDKFKVDLETQTKPPPNFSLKAAGTALANSVLYGFVLSFLAVLGTFMFGLWKVGWPDALIFLFASVPIILVWVVTTLQMFFKVDRLFIQNIYVARRPRIEFAEEFLDVFKSIVSGIKSQRLVIVIDNIDRCSPDVAMKVLSTIKNFLEPKTEKVFFLIPCDLLTLQRHLGASFRSRGVDAEDAETDANEYLSKFFGSSISIREFEQNELQALAASDLRRTTFGSGLSPIEVDSISFIAASTNRRSPRELKVFLNTVASNMLVFRHSHVPDGSALAPTDIAKLCALKDKAHDLWKIIERDPMALSEAEARINQENLIKDDDPIAKALDEEQPRRVVNAIQWHQVPVSKIRLFLGLRIPPQAEDIPRYFDLLTALQEADSETAIVIANEVGDEMLPALVDIVIVEILAVGALQPARAINPASVGLRLLAEFNVLPERSQAALISGMHKSILHGAVQRIGPTVAAKICVITKAIPQSIEIRRELTLWYGDQDESRQDELSDAINVIAPLWTTQEISEVQNVVRIALASNLGFEQRLRRLSSQVADQVITDDTVRVMAEAYVLPGAPDTSPNTSYALEVLEAHASRISGETMNELLERCNSFLISRLDSGVQFDDTDTQAIAEILSLAERAGATPVDAFGAVLEQRIDQNQPEIFQVLANRASEIEPKTSGRAREQMVRFVQQLIVGPVLPETFPTDEAWRLASQACQSYSAQSAEEVFSQVAGVLERQIDDTLIDLAFQLSSSMEDWQQLNELVTTKASSDLDAFGRFRARLAPKLPDDGLGLIFNRSVEPLITFLEKEDTFTGASDNLSPLVRVWTKDQSERIIDISIDHIAGTDENLVRRSAKLVQDAVTNHTPSNSSMARQRVVQALVDGPLGLEGPQELFNLQTDSIQHVAYELRLSVRNSIRGSWLALDKDPSRLIAVANKLVQADRLPMSDDLLQSVVDYSIQVENDNWGQQAAELLSSLAPSTNAMNGLDRESLARLNEKHSLSGEIRKYLDDDSGASDQQAAP